MKIVEPENATKSDILLQDAKFAALLTRLDYIEKTQNTATAALERRVDTTAQVLEKQVESTALAMDKRMDATAVALDKRLYGMNEFRSSLKDQAANFVTRDMLTSSVKEHVTIHAAEQAKHDTDFKMQEMKIDALQKIVYIAVGMGIVAEIILKFVLKI